jgi:hypothetical protein
MKRTYRDVLDAAARQHLPGEMDLYPRIAVRLARRSSLQALRARPAMAVLAALLSLALLSGVVYAVGRSLGYIPGVGIVDQGSALRVLEAPVVVERQGITLTVTQALASSDKTVVTYRVEGIPEAALARDFQEGQTPSPRCAPNDFLRMPDGTIASPNSGQGRGWGLGLEYRWTFDPLPEGVNQVTLHVSCLLETAPGAAPENWEVGLVFVPAPPDLTVVPVIEITPSPTAEVIAAGEAPSTPIPSPITIEQTIELEDGYILIGSFHSIRTADGLITSPYVWWVDVTDAEGHQIAYDYAEDVDLSAAEEGSAPWAYRILGKAHAWPLTLTVSTLEATLPDALVSFEFDTGPSPQTDQHWEFNRDLEIGGHTVRLLEVIRTPDGYAFSFQAEASVTNLGVDLRGFEEYFPPSGGGGGGDGQGSLSVGVAYADQIPEGKLTVVVRDLTIVVAGPWSIQWEPQGAAVFAPTGEPEGTQACVTDEVWPAARTSVAAEIPDGLEGRLVLYGRDPDSPAYGVSTLDLGDGSRRFLGEGGWPMVSPDGARVVYTTEAGLAVRDLLSDAVEILTGTEGGDFRMFWSPDGTRLAFLRGRQLIRLDMDGSAPQTVRDNAAIYHGLAGWVDSDHLLITEPGPEGVYVQSLDLAEGSTQNLFSISSNKADTVVSPDGDWIAYTTSLGGMSGNGLYISRLDSFEPRLVAALNGRALYFPIWSPDNRWLILSLPDLSDPADETSQVLVELETCRVIPLPELDGEVFSWGP